MMMVWRWGCERKKKIKDNSKTFDLRYWKDGMGLWRRGRQQKAFSRKVRSLALDRLSLR